MLLDLGLTRIFYEVWEKPFKMFFESPSKVSWGRFLNLSKRASWMNRETVGWIFPKFHEISGLKLLAKVNPTGLT